MASKVYATAVMVSSVTAWYVLLAAPVLPASCAAELCIPDGPEKEHIYKKVFIVYLEQFLLWKNTRRCLYFITKIQKLSPYK